MPHFDEQERQKRWGEILKGDLPCGQDISLDHEFDLLHGEIGKEKSLHSHEKTDWAAVYTLADSLLLRSKDLWPFAYGIVAVYHSQGPKDCAQCVNSLSSCWRACKSAPPDSAMCM